MELRQLRYLVALAEENSFTRAAEREHIAQPALSQQIQKLELETGLALVDRTTRRVSITEAGEMLVARARRILSELDAAQDELQNLRGIKTGHLTVGAMHTMGPVDVSLVLAIFHERHPQVELTVREDPSEELAEMLRVDELDLAFLSVTERIESHGLGLHQLVDEELVVILPRNHPLARHDSLKMRDLAGQQFISYRKGARLRELLDAAGRESGFEPDVKFESNDATRIRSLVSRGLAVAILPLSDAVAVGAEVGISRLTHPELTRDITLAWRADRRPSPAAEEFLRIVLATYAPAASLAGVAGSTRR
jgi:DNA-binding transcriptional LysR family regulator